MKILLTGTTGYIGQSLLPALLKDGHEVVCCVRDKSRFDAAKYGTHNLQVIEVDFLDRASLRHIPQDIQAAYYLIHSMSAEKEDFEALEKTTAQNFRDRLAETQAQQVVYLGGITNDQNLSKHLQSRKVVEEILREGTFHLTTLRAGIILGSGSASFEIMRDLVEKLPVMIAPKWLNTRSQPIAIRNVIEYLKGVLLQEAFYDQSYDIGGPDVLTYKEMLQGFAKVRHLKRTILTVPVMTPKLSSYWLYFVTSISYTLASNLVQSMRVEVICRENNLREQLGIHLLPYDTAIKLAFDRIQNEGVIASWKDAQSSQVLHGGISRLLTVPTFGCFTDKRQAQVTQVDRAVQRIWAIGGETGWYYADWLWKLRGFLDKLVGGVGLRRGRKNSTRIHAGESLDFWRVLYANKEEKRLLLYAEMKLPGEAWLEFRLEGHTLYQTATFRPLGVWGRLYWYSVLPFHAFIFKNMLQRIAT
ncbi:SDR family oxidoreductase [Rufibacter glacialis]|uniref:SDR family oxidoreductase n=1 Tax=Rufibacter glacialis TaxID=1259555 RepID=A0A5M8QHS5_9BACT|nr:SDR family oxidoreductase [Rufibacter glacialis]KAA6434336.1 SDR family oxidoreductase [Rufibacter glacialis]GGK68650.1 epimerase [Rufibacter glacialis]